MLTYSRIFHNSFRRIKNLRSKAFLQGLNYSLKGISSSHKLTILLLFLKCPLTGSMMGNKVEIYHKPPNSNGQEKAMPENSHYKVDAKITRKGYEIIYLHVSCFMRKVANCAYPKPYMQCSHRYNIRKITKEKCFL